MDKKIIIDKLNSAVFSNFIKRLLSIDKFIYLKIENNNIISNVYLPEHDAIKQQIISISTLFEMDESQLNNNIFKISFYNGNRVIDALKSFGTEDIKAEITFSKIDSNWIATSFLITNNNKTDKIKLPCADPAINFMDLTKDQIESIFNDNGKFFKFVLDDVNINKLNNRLNLEKDIDIFQIELKDNDVYLKSPNGTYETLVGTAQEAYEEESVQLYKRYLNLLDGETYECSVCHNKIILKSNESLTMISIATCQSD